MVKLQRQLVAALTSQLADRKARPPEGSGPLWAAFNRLSRQRSWHASGPNPLSFGEIEAYCRLMQLPLGPHHIEALLAMDQAWLAACLGRLRSDAAPVVSHVSKEAITPALWDAIIG